MLLGASSRSRGTRSQTAGGDAEDLRIAEAIADVSPWTHPHLAASADELLSDPPELRLTWGFDVLLNGILTTPRPDPLSLDPRR